MSERLTIKEQIFRDYGEEYSIKKANGNCRAVCNRRTKKNLSCEGCPIQEALNKLGRIEDRQINCINRITQRSRIVNGYITCGMDDDCSENSCADLCWINEGNCHKCDLFKGIQILGEYEDMEKSKCE